MRPRKKTTAARVKCERSQQLDQQALCDRRGSSPGRGWASDAAGLSVSQAKKRQILGRGLAERNDHGVLHSWSSLHRWYRRATVGRSGDEILDSIAPPHLQLPSHQHRIVLYSNQRLSLSASIQGGLKTRLAGSQDQIVANTWMLPRWGDRHRRYREHEKNGEYAMTDSCAEHWTWSGILEIKSVLKLNVFHERLHPLESATEYETDFSDDEITIRERK
jgi:hypothetical protein